MTFSLTVGGTNVAGRMVLPEGLGELTSAADGEENECQIVVDDPDGALTFQALAPVIAEESAAANPRLYTGIVTQSVQSRGSYRSGPGRIWTLTVTDLNERLHRRVFHAADAKRPAETGTARLTWLLASVGLSGLVWDNGLVMANAWNYDETDYRDQYADDVLATIVDAASAGRWTAFVYWDPTAPAGQEPSLFYGEVTSVTADSTLAISNVLTEVDDTTIFAPATNSEVTGEAAPIYDGVDVIGPFGRLYRQLPSTFATFGIHRDAVYETIRNNNLTSAQLHADSFLAHHAGQVDTIQCRVTLPRDKVTLITAGMRIGVYFSHLAGYDDPAYTFTRVSRCTVRFTDGTNDSYDLDLELSTRGIVQSGGGSPGGFPAPPPTTPVHWFPFAFNVHGDGGGGGDGEGWSGTLQHAVFAPSTDYHIHGVLTQDGDLYAPDLYVTQTFPPSGTPAYHHNLPWSGVGTNEVWDETFTTPDAAHGMPITGYVLLTMASGSHTTGVHGTFVGWIDPIGWDPGGGFTPPLPGQPVPSSLITVTPAPDNATTSFALLDPDGNPFPFADGSLIVLQDGFEQTEHVTSYDGAAGTFTLDYAPGAGATMTVRMQGR